MKAAVIFHASGKADGTTLWKSVSVVFKGFIVKFKVSIWSEFQSLLIIFVEHVNVLAYMEPISSPGRLGTATFQHFHPFLCVSKAVEPVSDFGPGPRAGCD